MSFAFHVDFHPARFPSGLFLVALKELIPDQPGLFFSHPQSSHHHATEAF